MLGGKGRTAADVDDALLVDPDTVRSYWKHYNKDGLDELLHMTYVGGEALLDEAQLAQLDACLNELLHLTVESVCQLASKNDQGSAYILDRAMSAACGVGSGRIEVIKLFQTHVAEQRSLAVGFASHQRPSVNVGRVTRIFPNPAPRRLD